MFFHTCANGSTDPVRELSESLFVFHFVQIARANVQLSVENAALITSSFYEKQSFNEIVCLAREVVENIILDAL